MSRISTTHIAENTVSTDIALDELPKPTTTNAEQNETIKEEPVTSQEKEEVAEDEDEERQFAESTHSYLIYFDEHKDCNNLLLSIFMYIMQMFLYSLLWSEAMSLVKEDQVEVTIGYMDCSDGGVDTSKLKCSADGEPNWYHMMLPYVLLSIYIQPDIISCLSLIFSKKSCFKRMAALIVFSEGAFALLTGLLWCFQGIYKGSGYDAIVNSIGVLFIHDLDEQLFVAIEKMNSSRMKSCIQKCCKRCTCCHNFGALFCTLLFVVIVAALGQVVSEVAWSSAGGMGFDVDSDSNSIGSDTNGGYSSYSNTDSWN